MPTKGVCWTSQAPLVRFAHLFPRKRGHLT